jgi:undecaprenyl-diphosphatase
MGLAQTLALIPGVSRSGATITAGRVLGFSREAAARFSFLLSIPAIVLSGLYEAAKNINTDGVPWGPTLLALVVAFLSGYAAIAWLLKYLVNHSMRSFAIYRVVVGAVVFTLAITEAIK